MNEAKRLYQRRNLDELNVLDDFLMSAAASAPEGGPEFCRLLNLYVITILPYDPFGQDLMVYRFQNMCRELPELDYPDGLRYIYFREGNEPKSDLSGLWRLPASSILP